MRNQILVVDDDPSVRGAVREALEPEFDVKTADVGGAALEALSRETPDATILDYRLPDMTGEVLTRRIRARHPDLPLIILSAATDVACVVRLMREGAVDYLSKPFDHAELRDRLRRAVGGAREVPMLRCEALLGMGPAVTAARRRIAELARDGRHILVDAERGFDLIGLARGVASLFGPRTPLLLAQPGDRPVVPPTFPAAARGLVYFALTPDTLGAVPDLLETARWRQAADDGRIQILFDAAALVSEPSAGPCDLPDLPASFGEDLARVHLPPLRERPEDIPHGVRYFIEKHARQAGRPVRSISLEAMDLLLSYSWPGNVLEMNCVMAEVIRRGRGPEIDTAAVAWLDFGALADSALRASRCAGETLQQGLQRLDRLIGAGSVGAA
jgi:two-component system nitrogen regulation response regulator GlnG